MYELRNGATIEPRATRINYRAWFWRVLAWDGILPLVVWVAPYLLPLIVPNREEPIMLAVIFTAIGVFLVRWWMGAKHIAANSCSPTMRQVQYLCFFAGLVVMLLTDAFALGMHGMLQPGDIWGLVIVLSIPFGIYLAFMSVAMYPGRELIESPAERFGNWEVTR